MRRKGLLEQIWATLEKAAAEGDSSMSLEELNQAMQCISEH